MKVFRVPLLSLAGCAIASLVPAATMTVPVAVAQAVTPGAASGPAVFSREEAANRKAAEREAHRLLQLAPLPPGAVRTGKPQGSLGMGPAVGEPASSSLLVLTQYWRVPMPLALANQWLASHPPLGLVRNTTSSGAGPLPWDIDYGYGYGDRAAPQWQSAELSVGVAPAGAASSVVRLDAMVLWVDPFPLPDRAQGSRLRVTVAGGCPAGDRGAVGVSNPGLSLTSSLLPAGEPAAALVCRYWGTMGTSGPIAQAGWFKLAHEARLGTVAAHQLARVVSAAPTSRTAVPFGFCPMDDGSAAVIAFLYPASPQPLPDVDIWTNLRGCVIASNGYILANGQTIAAEVESFG